MIPLDTERLRLRPFRGTDLDFIRRLHQHPELLRFIPSAATPDEAAARRHLERFMTLADHRVQGFTLVELRVASDGAPAGTPVGLVMVKPIPPSGGGEAVDLEIGWRQVAEHCGHGYITEASRAVLEAVLEASIDEVIAVAHPDNTPSHAVAERIGMRRVGLSRDYYDTETLLFRRRRSEPQDIL
jgi:RimJ/RimL family protein N-acetyltransferase